MNTDVLNESPFVHDDQEGQVEEIDKGAREVLKVMDGANVLMAKFILQRAEQYLDQTCFLDMENKVLQRKEPDERPKHRFGID